MNLRFLEVTNSFNYGKFALGTFDSDEWSYPSVLDATFGVRSRLIAGRGWGPDHFLMLDLQTGEGAFFRHGGLARADLNKHRIWVCPMFLPTLEHLYRVPLAEFASLPPLLELSELEAPSSMQGYRRTGVQEPFVEFT